MGASLPVPSQNDTSTQELIMSPISDVEAAESAPSTPPPPSRRQYQYPPPPGKKYFADNFKLGTKKFGNLKLQSFLFGDSSDLNFLPPEPGSIPFKRAPDSMPLPAIHSLLNLHTDSIRLVERSAEGAGPVYSLEFEFDSEVDCQVSVLFSVPVEHNPSFLTQENSTRPAFCSKLFSYPPGYRQKFSQSSFQVCLEEEMSTEFSFSPFSPTYPLLIKLDGSIQVPDCNRLQKQIHTTILSLESAACRYKPVVLKQRLTVDSLTFLLQEVYGLSKPGEEGEGDAVSLNSQTTSSSLQLDPGEECIVCLAEAKDTLILPCRHLTTCAQCASALKYQSKKCPVCRTEFQALLRIRPLLKPPQPPPSPPLAPSGTFASQGYQNFSLFQAVHGMTSPRRSRPSHLASTASGSSPPSIPTQDPDITAAPYPANTYCNPTSSPSPSPLAATPSDTT